MAKERKSKKFQIDIKLMDNIRKEHASLGQLTPVKLSKVEVKDNELELRMLRLMDIQ